MKHVDARNFGQDRNQPRGKSKPGVYLRKPCFSRRRTSRVDTLDTVENVSVCWRCNRIEDISPVRDLSFGGLFIETLSPLPLGTVATIDFLVPEGQIRADAVVRHVRPTCGLGLKFTAMPEADRPRLGMLITRLRHSSRLPAQIAKVVDIQECQSDI